MIRFIPSFDYILSDLSQLSNEEIKGKIFGKLLTQTLFSIFRDWRDPDLLRHHGELLVRLFTLYQEEPEGLKCLDAILRYIWVTTDIEVEKVTRLFQKTSSKGGEFVMTTATRLREEGIKEGKFDVARQMIKKKLDRKLIREITGLSEAELKKLERELK